MGQEVELIQDGWTIPKDYTFEKDKAEYTYRQPIFWKGEFDLKVKDSNAQIKGSMKSTIGDNKILIDQNVSVIKSKADYDYDEYLLDDSKKNCFMVLIGKQNIKFCDDRKSAADDMIKLVEKKYNKKFSQNRKNQIYSNYEK